MTEHLTRATPADLLIRAGGDGRTVCGLAVPFDQVATVDDGKGPFDESFARGSFARTIAERGTRVKFLAMHNRRALPLGRAVLLREDAAGLYGEFRVSQTAAGDEALELIRDGALDGLSVSFAPVTPPGDQWPGRPVRRTEVRLIEVSAVSFPAYAGALISAVRSADPAGPPPLLTEDARRRLDLLQRRKT